MGILAELDRGGMINRDVHRVDGKTLGEAIQCCDLINNDPCDRNEELYSAAPGGKFNLSLGSQDARYSEFDLDRKTGCIRSIEKGDLDLTASPGFDQEDPVLVRPCRSSLPRSEDVGHR